MKITLLHVRRNGFFRRRSLRYQGGYSNGTAVLLIELPGGEARQVVLYEGDQITWEPGQ